MSTDQRIVCFGVIISLLLLFVVVGCSNSDTSSQQSTNGETEDNETIEHVRVFKSHLSKGVLPDSDDPHVQQVLEETGVEYELMTPPAGSDATEYLNMLFASEDYPDIFRPIGGMERTLIQQGAALPLDDLLKEYAPHVWNSIPEEAWDVVRAATPDGKIYYVPKVYMIPERAALLRQDWLDNVGLDMPETLEEYREMLIAFRDQDPNGNGEKDELRRLGGNLVHGWITCLQCLVLQCGKGNLNGIYMTVKSNMLV